MSLLESVTLAPDNKFTRNHFYHEVESEMVDLSSYDSPIFERDNPYLKANGSDCGFGLSEAPDDVESGLLTVSVKTTAGEMCDIQPKNIQRALLVERKANFIIVLTLLDMATNLYYLVYGYWYPTLFLLCSYGGYVSSIKYHKKNIFSYLLYQYFQIILKISAVFFWTYKLIALHSHNKKCNSTYNMRITYTVLSITLATIQGIIAKHVKEFYVLLPSSSKGGII